MAKLFLALPALVVSYIILSGSTTQDDPAKWNIDSRSTRIYPSGEYTPLPQNDNIVFSTSTRIYKTPIGDVSVSPNFRVHPSGGTQSEVPITRHPLNPLIMFASANTYRGSGSPFGTGVYVTTNGGVNWYGSDTLNNGSFNFGDPGPVIDKDGRFLLSYITLTGSIGASYSTDNGITWAPTVTFPGATTNTDKNLSTTDDAPSSPFYGRSYTAYTEFSGPYINRIVLSYTTNGGVNWSNIAPVSPPPSLGHFHQGADLRVGPTGELYVVWANNINNGQNSTEDSLGFAKSTDGGVSWAVTKNNADNMNGIRNSGTTFLNGIRANSFPRIDVDRSGGPRNGWIYVVTSEKIDAPATDESDAILHRSSDGGATWSASRINQDTPGNGKYQYTTAVRVDEDGGLNVIYYDTRNTPTNDSAQIYMSRSLNGGDTWIEILISDHKFRPKRIPGLAEGYQGDYIGITSGAGKAWLYWCDDITGTYQAWIASVGVAVYPLNSYNLILPPAGTTISSYPNVTTQHTFTWDTAASSATYKWIFGNPTTNPRKITLETEVNSLTITSGQIDSLLALLGVATGDSLVGQWDVWAFRNNEHNDSLKANGNARAITLKRGIPPLSAFNLNTPSSGTTFTTSAFNNSIINSNWTRSGQGVTYKWKFGSPSISNISLSLTSDNSGVDSSLTIYNYELDGFLGGIGLNPGDSLVGQWSVWAYNVFDSVKASQDYALTLKRQLKGDVLILFDSSNANCRISRDSVVANLDLLGVSYEQFNKKGNTATDAISLRGFKKVLLLGESSIIMSNDIKDSIKSYLASGTSSAKSKLMIMSEDIGYFLDRSTSAYYDSSFARSTLGFQYVADRPGVGGKGITGIFVNTDLTDSTVGPSPDVIKRSASVPTTETFNIYKYRLFADSMNAVGRILPTYNVAVMAVDAESIRPASDSQNGFAVKRILYGLISFVDQVVTSSPQSNAVSLPLEYNLSQNYPNPFNPVTKINYQLPVANFVSLKVFDVLGKEVMTLVNENLDAGVYHAEFDGSNFSSGIYFYRIETGSFVETKRMLLIK